MTFSDASAQVYIGSGSNPIFSNNSAMQSAISSFNSETDGGATPYMAALSEVQTAIANDPDLNASGAQAALYYVIFMSDGYPTDTSSESQLTSAIQSITALAHPAASPIEQRLLWNDRRSDGSRNTPRNGCRRRRLRERRYFVDIDDRHSRFDSDSGGQLRLMDARPNKVC